MFQQIKTLVFFPFPRVLLALQQFVEHIIFTIFN